ncbi:Iron-sulfur cluster carrier protein [uncultured archaeon]|nr:Iron-sulfur cluster carrier protein [uncultured archaeon]
MKVITVHSFKGGTGKTNIIASISFALASAGYKVGVVDSDMAHPSLHIIYGMGNQPPHPTLTEFLLGKCESTEIVHDVSPEYGFKNKLYLIPSNLNEEIITKIVREGFEIGHMFRGLKEIGRKKNLDVLLIDTKPGLDEKTMLFFMMTDALFIVMRNDEADIRGTMELLKIIAHFKVPIKYIIPNMIESSHIENVNNELKKLFKKDDVIIASSLPYSSKLAMEHSPHIDKLFISKYPDDPFSKSILKLRDMTTQKMGI